MHLSPDPCFLILAYEGSTADDQRFEGPVIAEPPRVDAIAKDCL